MAYNPRMSIIPPGQAQARQRKKEPEPDAFMRLSDSEIVGCITDIGIPFTVPDLQKPNPIQVQMIFEEFASVLLNATRDTVDPAMRAAAHDVVGDMGDILMPADTRNLMGFYVSLRRLLRECGISDFNFTDLFKPTHDRLAKIFSYLINFTRFRESQTELIDEHYNRAETTKSRIDSLYEQNQAMESRLDEMQRKRQEMQDMVQEKTRRNDELKKRLLDLQKKQDKVREGLGDVKAKKKELGQRLKEKNAEKAAQKQECSKLRPYVLQSPSALQANLAELSNTLNNDKMHIDSLERRARALQTSSDSFAVVSTDVASCIKVLDETSAELAKEDDENAKKTKQRDALTERGADVKEVERTELMLQKQLAKWNERTEKLREQANAKAQDAKEKMEELKETHRKLNEQRSEKGRDIEKRRVRIEQTEKKMLDLKEKVEIEVHNAHDEYLKMEAHIKLYITEMEQSL